ncbi:MAG TPA: penicillin-binding transpeptidase domain-containing protein [Pyrinomonadaceae bacterium]|nr:penicillin-binding transpeptidase domain-containing protein [Pyrinomonadaceae bacterium]
MEAIWTQPFLRALGWALLHFLWQGAGVGLLLAGVLAFTRGRSSHVRYVAACAALALMLVLPAATVWRTIESPHGTAQIETDEAALSSRSAAETNFVRGSVAPWADKQTNVAASEVSPSRQRQFAERLDGVLPWLILFWALGVLALSARTLGGLVCAQRLKRQGTRPVLDYWQDKLKEISKSLRVTRTVHLLESSLVYVPTVVGWLRPVVLLPASAFTGLTREQLEAVLAHELAHIRRHDYAVNLLQTITETLLFYHPAVWWVSRKVRVEREHVCDDLAVSVSGDALCYARALTKVERLRMGRRRQLAMAADGGELRARILRLVETSQGPRRASSLFIGTMFVAALLATVACTRAVFSQNHGSARRAASKEAAPALIPATTVPVVEQRSLSAQNPPVGSETARLIANDVTDGEDPEVRRVVLGALGSHEGSVVVMDARTGRVYAVVNQEWALRRGWQPASTMKLVTGLAGIGENVFDPSEKMRVGAKAARLDLTDALAVSDNSYFKSLGERIGTERILSYARRLGFGEATGINYEGEIAGHLPSPSARLDAGNLGTAGEGVEVTPIQLAALVSAIANGGTLLTPRVPRTPQEAAQFEARVRRPLDISGTTLTQVVPGMIAAVERGTASGPKGAAAKMAGKTGTLQGKDSSLGIFASYAPLDAPRLVIVVFTRGPAENGRGAASITGTIYRALSSRL